MLARFLQIVVVSILLNGCVDLSTDEASIPQAPENQNEFLGSYARPQRIALLLPMQGDLANAGKAIEEGFEAVYSAEENKPQIKIYDTAENQSIIEIYSKAIKEGANFVIGPLSKGDVATLQASDNFPVPTITLNNAPIINPNPNFYEFSLSPIDEAEQVADQAAKDGYHSAIFITPAGPWGESIASALQSRWKVNGGIIVEQLSVGANSDLTQLIRQLLHVQGKNRRQDMDVIFLITQPMLAKQIKPLLKFYYAGQIPVYSTSLIYSGLPNADTDKDLDDIIFCDMPLVIDNSPEWTNLRQQLQSAWPMDRQPYIRLYGLGRDAALLSKSLNKLNNSSKLMGATGMLYKDEQLHILRQLNWAQFQSGQANSIA